MKLKVALALMGLITLSETTFAHPGHDHSLLGEATLTHFILTAIGFAAIVVAGIAFAMKRKKDESRIK